MKSIATIDRLNVISMMTCIFLVGCVPIELLESPAISGHVTDDTSGMPIAGARVSTRPTDDPDKGLSAVTDQSGHFALPPSTRQVWVPIMLDPIGPRGHVRIEADGYASQEFDFFERSADGSFHQSSEFSLRHL